MEQLRTGTFFGTTNETVQLDFCTITNTEYTLDKVDWHYHENAYFTFILKGKLLECKRKPVIVLQAPCFSIIGRIPTIISNRPATPGASILNRSYARKK